MSSTDLNIAEKAACPCGSGKIYPSCCGSFHEGMKLPQTAEELMRSRYSAYAMGNLSYIKNTMQGKAAQNFSDQDPEENQSSHQLLGLEVIRHFVDKKNPLHAFVEFRALHQFDEKFSIIQELSEFSRVDGKWFYLDGKIQKSSRNDPCPCHSGKKFKKCHGFDN